MGFLSDYPEWKGEVSFREHESFRCNAGGNARPLSELDYERSQVFPAVEQLPLVLQSWFEHDVRVRLKPSFGHVTRQVTSEFQLGQE